MKAIILIVALLFPTVATATDFGGPFSRRAERRERAERRAERRFERRFNRRFNRGFHNHGFRFGVPTQTFFDEFGNVYEIDRFGVVRFRGNRFGPFVQPRFNFQFGF